MAQEIGGSKRILDIGCGDGATAFYLISSLSCDVRGIDADAGKIHRANEKIRRKLRNRFAVCENLKAEDMRRNSFQKPFDAVIIIHAFHHLGNVKKALAKSKSVLSRGGKIIIAEYTNSFGENIDDCPRFSAEKILLLVKQSGFSGLKKINISSGLFAIIGYKK